MGISKQGASRRPDIQGLRAFGVVAVVLFHLWPSVLTGGYVGVDIFFVISGYLITKMLVGEAESTGTIRCLSFYYRRIKRLLPAATFVLLVVAVFIPLLPPPRWHETAIQIATSALYVQNWQLAWLASDYFGSTNFPSPVRHYWSLSLEEQLYLAWPWVLLLCTGALARNRLGLRPALLVVLSTVTLLSFVSSLWLSYTDVSYAYFATHARAWEFGLGGLLVLAPRLSNRVRLPVSYIGLAFILSASFFFTKDTVFPGLAALVPTLGTVMMIAAGVETGAAGANAWLSYRPFQYLGDVSYSCYLWHWPLIVFYAAWTGRNPGTADGLTLIVLTLLLSHFTKEKIEDRFRYRLPGGPIVAPIRISLVSIGSCLIAALAIWIVAGPTVTETAPATHPGARALIENINVAERMPIPNLASAKDDDPILYKMDCHAKHRAVTPIRCDFGAQNGRVHVVLVGDLHAAQWFPPLNTIASERGWRLSVYTKSACPFVPLMLGKEQPYTECLQWTKKVLKSLRVDRPDMVIVAHQNKFVNGSVDNADSDQRFVVGLQALWASLSKLGIQVIAIRDTPNLPFDVPECLSRHGSCSGSRTTAISNEDLIVIAAHKEPSVALLDFTDAICGPVSCAPIVGNVIVRRDCCHLTATYALSLKTVFATALDEVLRRKAGPQQQQAEASTPSVSRWSQGPFTVPLDGDKIAHSP